MACREEKRNAHRILVGIPEGKWLLGRLKRRFEDNIKPNLKEMGWRGVDSSGLRYGKVASSCEHGNKHLNYIKLCKFLTRWWTTGFSIWPMFCRMNELTRTTQGLIFVRRPWFRKKTTEHEIRKMDVSFSRRKKGGLAPTQWGPFEPYSVTGGLSVLI